MIDELKIRKAEVLPDPEEAVRHAIRNPIGCRPLKEIARPGQTVAFIVNDPTRIANSDVFLPILVEELNSAGVADKDMFVIFALGTHRNMTADEMAEAVGPEVAKRLRMYNNESKDDSQFNIYGTTSRGTPVHFNNLVAEADHIICTGSVVHHFFAGFGGGRKAMLPGVSNMKPSAKTIV